MRQSQQTASKSETLVAVGPGARSRASCSRRRLDSSKALECPKARAKSCALPRRPGPDCCHRSLSEVRKPRARKARVCRASGGQPRPGHLSTHCSGESKSQSHLGVITGGWDDSICLMGFASDAQSEDCSGQVARYSSTTNPTLQELLLILIILSSGPMALNTISFFACRFHLQPKALNEFRSGLGISDLQAE